MTWLAQEGRPFFLPAFIKLLCDVCQNSSMNFPWKFLYGRKLHSNKAERWLLSTEISCYLSKRSPNCLHVKLWCPTSNLLFSSLFWAEIVLVTAAEPHPHSRISMESGARHHETWNIAMVLKGQSGREREIFIPQISKRYFGMQILRGWFFLPKTWNFSEKDKGESS